MLGVWYITHCGCCSCLTIKKRVSHEHDQCVNGDLFLLGFSNGWSSFSQSGFDQKECVDVTNPAMLPFCAKE